MSMIRPTVIISLVFIANIVIAFTVGYSLAQKKKHKQRYKVSEIRQESDLLGCGEIVLTAENGETVTRYVKQENMIYQMISVGDYLICYHDEKLGSGLAIPLGELGEKKCGAADFKGAWEPER